MSVGIQWDSPLNIATISLMRIICLIGIEDKYGEGGNEIREETTRKERARFLINRINQHNDLARIAKEIESQLGRNAVRLWRIGGRGHGGME